jgi:hypothetical protein
LRGELGDLKVTKVTEPCPSPIAALVQLASAPEDRHDVVSIPGSPGDQLVDDHILDREVVDGSLQGGW